MPFQSSDPPSPTVGDKVNVSGVTSYGTSRSVVASKVTRVGSGTVTPLVLNLSNVDGGAGAEFGTPLGTGLTNTGLLVRVC